MLIATTGSAAENRASALRQLGCEVFSVEAASGKPSVTALLTELGKRRCTNVLIEGGMQIRETFEIAGDHVALPTAAAVTAVRLLSSSSMKLSTSVRPIFMGGVTRITLP